MTPTPRIDESTWRPHAGPQTEFLQATEFEVLYGGAAGGGKSDALIVDACGLNGTNLKTGEPMPSIAHPKYRALILRQNFTDLKQVIDRCNELYPQIDPGVVWKKGERQFEFSSGARIELGHVSEAGDEQRYKSREFQYIGWEELTEHATDVPYIYLMSRCRGPVELAKYIRATTNPDGPGHSWVKARWRIPSSGSAVPAFEERLELRGKVFVRTRRFIPARVTDNPSMDPGYELNLLMMPEQDQKALHQGRWDGVDVKGTILKEQIERAIREERFCRVPYDSSHPVNTFWDIGANDKTAIWFHQYIGYQNRFIDYFEDAHKPLTFFYDILREKRYSYGVHYFPHDAAHRKLGAIENRSVQEIAEDIGIRPIDIVPRIESITQGIAQTRLAFSTCVFDEHRCAQGIEHLKNWRFKYDARTGAALQRPMHNDASNGADAFRQFAQGFYEAYGEQDEDYEDDRPPAGLGVYTRKRKGDFPEDDYEWLV